MKVGRCVALVALVAVAGCEDVTQSLRPLTEDRFKPLPDTTSAWENPNVPWESWGADRSECRAVAAEQAEREYALDSQAGPALDYSRTQEYQRAVNTFEAQRVEETLFERCMKDRGYRRVPRAQGDPAPAPL